MNNTIIDITEKPAEIYESKLNRSILFSKSDAAMAAMGFKEGFALAYELALLEAAKVARADKHLLTGMRSAAGEKISEKILQLGNLQDKDE